MATRAASGEVLSALAPVLPELWGGSADLAGSNNTTMDGEPSFVPADRQTKDWKGGPYGRTLHFGIREHAMGAVLNGIALQSLTRPYGGTFLTFSDYMRPAVRLAALMQLPATYVWTHDSIGLGEDGPTHQPVEHLAALRAIPGLDVVRPADANETAACWRTVLEHGDRPAALILTRQNVPVLDRGSDACAPARDAARGGYVLTDTGEDGSGPDVILVATGSEVHIALEASGLLATEGLAVRVVSMPCREWFAAQPPAYQDEVLPPSVRARVSVEAAVGQGWRDVVGDAGRIVSLEHYGASADYERLYTEFGLTPRPSPRPLTTASATPAAPRAPAVTARPPPPPRAAQATAPDSSRAVAVGCLFRTADPGRTVRLPPCPVPPAALLRNTRPHRGRAGRAALARPMPSTSWRFVCPTPSRPIRSPTCPPPESRSGWTTSPASCWPAVVWRN